MIGITGGGGVLGHAMRDVVSARDVVSFDSDIRDASAVERWIHESGATSVLHFAAIVPVRKVEADPKRAFEVNVAGTLHVCEAIRKSDRKIWLFLASTSHVYSPSSAPLTEESSTDPHSLYGFTKLEAERIATTWSTRYELPLCIGRIFSFSAKTQSDDYVVPSLVRRIREAESGATLTIAGGNGSRDFLTASEVAKTIACLMDRRATGVFNIGSGKATRIIDLARSLATALGRRDLEFVAETGSHQTLLADTSKISRLGCRPEAGIEHLIAEFV